MTSGQDSIPANPAVAGASTERDDGRLRIAWLVYRGNPHSGGQGVYTRYVARELVAMGHHVDVLSGPPYPVLDDGVRLITIPSLDLFRPEDPWHVPRPGEIADRVRRARRLGWAELGTDVFEFAHMCTSGFPEPWTFSQRARRWFRAHPFDYDLVHDNQCLGYGILDIAKRVPLIATLHHPITIDRDLEIADLPKVYPSKRSLQYAKRRWSLMRWYGFLGMQVEVAKQIPRIITVSESSKRDIVAQMHVRAEQLHIVPVGVDQNRFRPLGIPRKPHRVMTTASADVPLKGLRPLLEAIAKVKAERPVDLVIVGKQREGSVIPELLERLGIADVVTFESGVSDERIVELYNEAEVVVVPSLYEGFSIPAIEAMACGTPLVTTTGGALPEVVGPNGEAALTVPPGDPGALAQALLDVLGSEELRARLGAAGRARVLQGFTWRVAAQGCVEQYRAAIEDRRRAVGTRPVDSAKVVPS